MSEIVLTRGMVAVVDEADFARVGKFKWYAHRSRGSFYAARSVRCGGKKIATRLLHHAVLGIVRLKPGYVVDHIDHDPMNCRRGNLRICTVGQNNARQRPRRCVGSPYKGVSYQKGNGVYGAGFKASITHEGKRHYLGFFREEREAVAAYNAAARRLLGEFAYENVWKGPTPKERLGDL